MANRIIHRLGVNQLCLESPFPRQESAIHFSDFDVIHLHDVARLNLRWLPWLTKQSPVCWTIHSMAPLTGNCVYPFACDRWKQNCGQCPQFGHWPLTWLHRDGSALNLTAKRWLYRQSRFQAIGVSEWVSDRIRESVMACRPVTTIQNAVDTTAFSPIEKSPAKKALGISPDRFTIGFSVAADPADLRKGTDIILQAAAGLRDLRSITFMPMSIGPECDRLQQLLGQAADVLPARHLSTDEELRAYYSAADLIWHPSRADTSSMVSMEAMACGTPVIAASVGGVPEVIGDAGVLIPPDSPEDLILSTRAFLADEAQQAELRHKARIRVVDRFSMDRFLDDHERLYDAMTGRLSSGTSSRNSVEEPASDRRDRIQGQY